MLELILNFVAEESEHISLKSGVTHLGYCVTPRTRVKETELLLLVIIITDIVLYIYYCYLIVIIPATAAAAAAALGKRKRGLLFLGNACF